MRWTSFSLVLVQIYLLHIESEDWVHSSKIYYVCVNSSFTLNRTAVMIAIQIKSKGAVIVLVRIQVCEESNFDEYLK